MSKERKFVGKGKKVGDYDLINISLAKSKLEGNWYEYNGEHYIKLSVGALREIDQYGKTHSVWIDDYKPDATKAKTNSNVEEVDLPF